MVVLADSYPYGPICLFIILFPAYLLFIYEVFLTHVMSARVFMGVIPKPLIAMSGCLALTFFVWSMSPNNRAPTASSVQKMVRSHISLPPNQLLGLLFVSTLCALVAISLPPLPPRTTFTHDRRPSPSRQLYSVAIGCVPGTSEDMTDDYEDCTEAFLMWVFPIAMALAILSYGTRPPPQPPPSPPCSASRDMYVRSRRFR